MLEENTMLDKFGLELFVDPAPPQITDLFGYTGHRRWVAFFWGQEDGFLRFFDGYLTGPGNQLAWDAFFKHPLVVGLNRKRENGQRQKRFEFGDAFIPPCHWLISDCQQKSLYAGPTMAALKFLCVFLDQFPEDQRIKALGKFQLDRTAHKCKPSGGRGLEKIDAMLAWLDNRMTLVEPEVRQFRQMRREGR